MLSASVYRYIKHSQKEPYKQTLNAVHRKIKGKKKDDDLSRQLSLEQFDTIGSLRVGRVRGGGTDDAGPGKSDNKTGQ